MSASANFAFSVAAERIGGGVRQVARAWCAECGRTVDVTIKRDGSGLNPEFIAKKIREKGWEFHEYRKRDARCPECIENRKETRKMASPPLTVGDPAKIAYAKAEALFKPNGPTAPRALTTEDRARIRQLLDKHFDDKDGRYLDGYSDQRVADELSLPRLHVEQVREVGYGPIKMDPAIAALQERLDALDTRARAAVKDMETRGDTILAELRAIRGEIDKLKMVSGHG